MTTTRFAPSPTGHIHVGNLRTALMNWLIARKAGGSFILRLDDTDRERSKQEYADGIQRDLEWLGLTWDRIERQSDRLDRYAEAADQLRAAGRLYEVFETPTELDLKRKKLLKKKVENLLSVSVFLKTEHTNLMIWLKEKFLLTLIILEIGLS